MIHYSDKRNIGTLEYQMTTLAQYHENIPTFYQKVCQHLSLILDKIICWLSDEVRSRQVNYQIRPGAFQNNLPPKQPFSAQIAYSPNKIQQNFYTITEATNSNDYPNESDPNGT